MMIRQWFLIAVVASGVLAAGCAAATAQMSATAKPAATKPTAAAQASKPARVNIDEIFPPGNGRDLVLQNCVNCHTITPIALARKSENEWQSHRTEHRPRVVGLSDADADLLWSYLTANFAPGRPVPELPQELLDTWTSY